jgi:chromosomal replication initiation ATPase DnaA
LTAPKERRDAADARPEAGQIPLPLPHRPALGGEDFLVAPCNADAVRWIDLWPNWPGPALAVVGPKGSGKTHLASVWAAASGARFIDPGALAGPDWHTEPGDGALILDDAHLLMGDGAAEQALFHLLNRVHGAKGRLMLTGDAPPARWPVALRDLRSRLGAIPVAEIGLPDDGLMAALLVKLFADRQIHVGVDVITFLTARMERSFAAASDVVAAIDRRALAAGRAVTVPLVRDVLAEGG